MMLAKAGTFFAWALVVTGSIITVLQTGKDFNDKLTYEFGFNATHINHAAAGQLYDVHIKSSILNHHSFTWTIFENTIDTDTNTIKQSKQVCTGDVSTGDWGAMLEPNDNGPGYGTRGSASKFVSNLAALVGKTGYFDGHQTYHRNAYRNVSEAELFAGKIPTDLDGSNPLGYITVNADNRVMTKIDAAVPATSSSDGYDLCQSLLSSSPKYRQTDGTLTTCTGSCQPSGVGVDSRAAYIMLKNPNQVTSSLASGITAIYEALNLIKHDEKCVDEPVYDSFEAITNRSTMASYGSWILIIFSTIFLGWFVVFAVQTRQISSFGLASNQQLADFTPSTTLRTFSTFLEV